MKSKELKLKENADVWYLKQHVNLIFLKELKLQSDETYSPVGKQLAAIERKRRKVSEIFQ